jgi:hypothetical protein
MLQAGRLRVRDPMWSIIFSIYVIIRAAVGQGLIQTVTEMSTGSRKIFLGSRARPVRKTDSLTAIQSNLESRQYVIINISKILYFSILLHCIVQKVLRLCCRLRAALL